MVKLSRAAVAGTGTVLGKSWPRQVKSIRDPIGYLPEDDCYILGLQGVESVQMMARLSGLPSTEALRRAHEVLDFCDVGQGPVLIPLSARNSWIEHIRCWFGKVLG